MDKTPFMEDRKAHLGGILRIFAKSMRDVTGPHHIKGAPCAPEDVPSCSENKLSAGDAIVNRKSSSKDSDSLPNPRERIVSGRNNSNGQDSVGSLKHQNNCKSRLVPRLPNSKVGHQNGSFDGTQSKRHLAKEHGHIEYSRTCSQNNSLDNMSKEVPKRVTEKEDFKKGNKTEKFCVHKYQNTKGKTCHVSQCPLDKVDCAPETSIEQQRNVKEGLKKGMVAKQQESDRKDGYCTSNPVSIKASNSRKFGNRSSSVKGVDTEDWNSDLLDVKTSSLKQSAECVSNSGSTVHAENKKHDQIDKIVPSGKKEEKSSRLNPNSESIQTVTQCSTGYSQAQRRGLETKEVGFGKSDLIDKKHVQKIDTSRNVDRFHKRQVTEPECVSAIKLDAPVFPAKSRSARIKDTCEKLKELDVDEDREKHGGSKQPCSKALLDGCSALPCNEDWSSDLIDTSVQYFQSIDQAAVTSASEGHRKHSNGVVVRNCKEEVSIGDVCKDINDSVASSCLLDDDYTSQENTLIATEDEDWSYDLINIPPSTSVSPDCNVLIHSQSERRSSCSETRSCLEDKVDLQPKQPENGSSHFLEGDIYVEENSSKVLGGYDEFQKGHILADSSGMTCCSANTFTGFVDELSDATSEQEVFTDLESQGFSGGWESCEDESSSVYSPNSSEMPSRKRINQVNTSLCQSEAQTSSFEEVHESKREGHRKRQTESQEEMPILNRKSTEEFQGQQTSNSPSYVPFLTIPVQNINSRDAVEKLMHFIQSQINAMDSCLTNPGDQVWFNMTNNHHLEVGFSSSMYTPPPGFYPWNWDFNSWLPYVDPRYHMYNPNLSPNVMQAYYDDWIAYCNRSYRNSFNNSFDADGRMADTQLHRNHVHDQDSVNADKRIVDYDSSSEDDRLTGASKKSYACVASAKRTLTDSYSSEYFRERLQPESSAKRLHSLGAPKRAQTLCSNQISRGDTYTAKGVQYKTKFREFFPDASLQQPNDLSWSSDLVRDRRTISDQTRCSETGYLNPMTWRHNQEQSFNESSDFDSFGISRELEDSFESDRREAESVAAVLESTKSPGCYPALTLEKLKSRSKDVIENKPPLIPPVRWATWSTKDPEALPKEVKTDAKTSEYGTKSTVEDGERLNRSAFDASSVSSTVPKPPGAPFWAEPRMGYPYPPCFSPPWIHGYPGFVAYPQPVSLQSQNTANVTQRQSRSSGTAEDFCHSPGFHSFNRTRTMSAPATDIDNVAEKTDAQSGETSCKDFFLSGKKNRRVSDSLLRPPSNANMPPRSSYASRLQNDSRLHGEAEWKRRLKSRGRWSSYKFIDTHCHLDFLYSREGFKGTFAKYMSKHEDTFPENFEGCVAVFCNPASFLPFGGLWMDTTKEPNVWLAMGCHPKMVTDFDTVAVDGLRKCILHEKVIAVGEIGLDYSGTFRQHEELQKRMFAFQLQMALEVKKPLVIHCREAEDDCLAIMEEIVPRNYRIHCHCFTGTYSQCQKWLSRFPNLYIGLTNLVSFKTATPTHDVARQISLDRLLLETDAPYFVPRQVPKGEFEFSHPGMALYVAEEISRIRNIPVDDVLSKCRSNTLAMYGI